METYGNEINQLIEEALNRINARHRGRALFAGTQLKLNLVILISCLETNRNPFSP